MSEPKTDNGSVDRAPLSGGRAPLLPKGFLPASATIAILAAPLLLGGCKADTSGGTNNFVRTVTAHHDNVDTQALKTLLNKVSRGQVHLVQAKPGPDGLTEMIVEVDHHKAVAWVLPGDHEVVYGSVYDEKGRDLTVKAAQAWEKAHAPSALTRAIKATSRPDSTGSAGTAAHGGTGHQTTGRQRSQAPQPAPGHPGTGSAKPGASSAPGPQAKAREDEKASTNGYHKPHSHHELTPDEVYASAKQARGVTVIPSGGHGTLYVLADPQCEYCEGLLNTIRSHKGIFTKSGVGLHWLPVEFLDQTVSLRKGARWVAGGRAAMEHPQKKVHVTKADRRAVAVNTMILLHDGKQPATPTLIYRSGGKAHVVVGQPSQSKLRSIVQAIREGR